MGTCQDVHEGNKVFINSLIQHVPAVCVCYCCLRVIASSVFSCIKDIVDTV